MYTLTSSPSGDVLLAMYNGIQVGRVVMLRNTWAFVNTATYAGDCSLWNRRYTMSCTRSGIVVPYFSDYKSTFVT